MERRLPGGVLSDARGDDVAHDALVHLARLEAGSRDRLTHDERAKLRCGRVLQRAEKLAGGRTDGREDDGVL